MKKTIIMLFLLVGNMAHSQVDTTSKVGKLIQARNKYYSEKLNLTESEKLTFFPIYDSYKKSEREIAKAFKTLKKLKKIEDMTDAEAQNLFDESIKTKEKQLALTKEYSLKFKNIIGIKRTIQLFKIEKEFQALVIKKIKEKNEK